MNTLQLKFLMLIFARWVNRSQQDVIEYLREEEAAELPSDRVLREQLGGKRLLFTGRQRRRLAAKAKAIAAGEARKRCVAKRLRGRKGLFEISTLVTPDTLLRWYRKLIANKYDGSRNRTVGRPRTAAEIEELILQMRPRRARLHIESSALSWPARILPGVTRESEEHSITWGTLLAATRSSEFSLIMGWIPPRFEEERCPGRPS